MFLQDAEVHHHEDSCLARFLRSSFLDYALLHPDRWNLQLNRLIDNFFHELRPPENVYDIDLLRHFKQRSVSFLTQAGFDLRIHWNYAVTVVLHISRNAMTRAQRIVG